MPIDRIPKPAPFPIGARLVYVGTLRASYDGGAWVIEAGVEVVILEAKPGHRGTGRVLDHDEDGPIRDRTRDGRSVYATPAGRHTVTATTAGDWRLERVELARWNVRGTGGPMHAANGPLTVCGRAIPTGAARHPNEPIGAVGCLACTRRLTLRPARSI